MKPNTITAACVVMGASVADRPSAPKLRSACTASHQKLAATSTTMAEKKPSRCGAISSVAKRQGPVTGGGLTALGLPPAPGAAARTGMDMGLPAGAAPEAGVWPAGACGAPEAGAAAGAGTGVGEFSAAAEAGESGVWGGVVIVSGLRPKTRLSAKVRRPAGSEAVKNHSDAAQGGMRVGAFAAAARCPRHCAPPGRTGI